MKITGEKWERIKGYYSGSMKSSIHCAVATVGRDGEPNVTPIGSLILTDNNSGYFFDIYTGTLSDNLDNNSKVCVMFVNTGKIFWIKSLYKNKFIGPSGLKLAGTAGNKRKAAEEEIAAFRDRIKLFKRLKGYHTLWGDLEYVRDVKFTEYYPVNTGNMTYNL